MRFWMDEINRGEIWEIQTSEYQQQSFQETTTSTYQLLYSF